MEEAREQGDGRQQVRDRYSQGVELCPLIEHSNLVAEKGVEQQAHWVRHGEQDDVEEPGHVDGLCAGPERVPPTDGLRDNLSKDDDGGRGCNDCNNPVGELLKKNRKRVVRRHVANQQATQQIVAYPCIQYWGGRGVGEKVKSEKRYKI